MSRADGHPAERGFQASVANENRVRIYLEAGTRRTFAGAVEWPGWCRSGRDEAAAIAALLGAAPRYARALKASRLGFVVPDDQGDFTISHRLTGTATTDFGAPDCSLPEDEGAVPEQELRRLQEILKACWRAFDAAVDSAAGRRLRKGPRGGGRDLKAIVRHTLEADAAYLSQLGRRYKLEGAAADAELKLIRRVMLDSLAEVAPHGRPPPGPRGGVRWTPRYFVRRVAWHALDHAWEIEDRRI
jgi:hypothetical protein